MCKAKAINTAMDNLNEDSPSRKWAGSIRAMLTKHSDKFSTAACKKKGKKKKGGKLCPYAIAWSQKNKGAKSHYKAQEKSTEGTPHKDKTHESTFQTGITFEEYLAIRGWKFDE